MYTFSAHFFFCQGSVGEKGEPGQKGDKGDKGEDGKTYQAVIINNYDVKNGKITQDKYFIEPGESVTLKFEPAEGYDIITKFEINGEEIEISPDAKEYVIQSSEADMGFQITAGLFGNISTYGNDQIDDYLLSLNKKDPFVKTGVEDEELDYVNGGTIVDTEIVLDAKADALAELAKVRKAFEEDTSVADKVKALDEAVKAQLPTIDEAYEDALKQAKEDANELLDSLSEAITSDNYTDEDREKDLKAAKDAVEAATSLKEINSVVQENDIIDSEDKTTVIFEEGSGHSLLTIKNNAFTALESALAAVLDKQSDLDPEDPGHETLVDALKTWGVSVDSFPGAVAKEYLTKVSNASSFEVYEEDAEDDSYSKGDVKLVVEGTKAITETLTNLKKETIAAVRNSYYAEIDGSTVLADAPNAKTTLKAVIEGIIAGYAADKNADLKDLVDVESGMVATIENSITGSEGSQTNLPITVITAFNTERVVNASKDAKKVLSAKVNEMLAADSVYASAINWSKVETGEHKDEYKVTGKLGVEEKYQVDNPFVGTLIAGTGTDKNYYSKTVSANYSIKEYLTSLFDEDGALLAKDATATNAVKPGSTPIDKVLIAKQTVAVYLTGFAPIYESAKDLYQSTQKTKQNVSELSGEWDKLFDKETASEEQFDSYVFADVSNAAKAFSTSAGLLFGEKGANTIYERAFKDLGIRGTRITKDNSTIDNKYETLKTNVLTGKADEKDVEEFTKSISKYYAADLVEYKKDTVTLFNDTVNNYLTNAASVTVEKARIIKERQAKALATLDEDKWYDNNSYDQLDQWLADAKAWVDPANGTGAEGVKLEARVSFGCLGIEDLEDTDTKTKEELYLAAVKEHIKTLELGAEGYSVKNAWAMLAKAFSGQEGGAWNTPNMSSQVVLSKKGNWIDSLTPLFNSIKLPSKTEPKYNGEGDNKTVSLTYDLSSFSKIDAYYKDVVTVFNTMKDRAVDFSTTQDSLMASIKSTVGSFIGKKVDTEFTAEILASELQSALNKYFKDVTITEEDISVGEQGTDNVGKITKIEITTPTGANNAAGLVMTASLTSDGKVSYLTGTDATAIDNWEMSGRTHFGFQTSDGIVTDGTNKYSILSKSDLSKLASAVAAELAKVDGKEDTTASI